jgi:hypothetical protein
MSVRKIVDKFGGQSALAELVGVKQSAVAYWVKKGAIPSKWHSKILRLANDNGVLIAPSELETSFSEEPIAAAIADGNKTLEQVHVSVPALDTFENSPFLFYASQSGVVKVQVLVEQETVWATQRGMAEIFEVDVRTISEHLQNIFKSGELDDAAVIRKFRITATDNKKYDTSFYNLDAVISVGYRVNSFKATQFRVWATTVLKEYLIKGFALDDDRLKQGKSLFGKDYFDDLLEKIREIRASERRFYQKITDIYAQCSIDYDPNAPISQKFYAHVQDKLHFAIHGKTSAELIDARANANKPHMGLTHWKNEVNGGKVTKLDVTVGKNYLNQSEIDELNRLVSMYLDFAENIARRQKALTMKDWVKRLDDFLEFNTYDVLNNFGKIRRDVAEKHAVQEYEKFRIVQDIEYKSDFDKVVDEIRIKKKLPKN